MTALGGFLVSDIKPDNAAHFSHEDAMHNLSRDISQQFLSDPDTQTKAKEDIAAGVGKLLQEALDNGTIEKALSNPTQIRRAPLPSCPHLSSKSFQNQIKALLEDACAMGSLSLSQAEELRDLMASYNVLQRQAQDEDVGEMRCQMQNALVASLENGTLQQAIDSRCAAASVKPLELFPIVREVIPMTPEAKEEMDTNVGKLLQDALNNGTLEKALSTPAVVDIPLKSCPGMSAQILKKSIRIVLENGVAVGHLSLDEAEQLKNLIASYNHLQSQQQAEQDALRIIDYSKLFQYTPPARQANTSAKPSKLEDMDHPSSANSSDFEKELQRQERANDFAQ